MGDILPPDPYLALNVPKDATDSAIKSAYRKAALKCHPDKAKDKGDDFHRIQQAYEILGDEEQRSRYDDQVRLAGLRRDVYDRRGGVTGADGRSPPNAGVAFTTRLYEERRPSTSRQYDDESKYDGYFDVKEDSRASARKYDGYGASPRRPQPPERMSARTDENRRVDAEKMNAKEKDLRSDRKKQREREINRERGRRSAFVDDDSGESDEGQYEATRRRERERERTRYLEDQRRRGGRRSSEDFLDERSRKLQVQTSDVNEYISRAKGGPGTLEVPPPYARSSSSLQETQYEVRRGGKGSRPSMVRKSSSRPNTADSPPRSSGRDRERKASKTPDLADAATFERRPPHLHASHSSPSSVKIPPPERRSRTADTDHDTRPWPVQRADTMPVNKSGHRTVPRRVDANPNISSPLRHTETNDSGYSTSSPSETPEPPLSTYTKYYYGVDLEKGDMDDNVEYANGHPTILREPVRTRRSPEPIPAEREHDRPTKATAGPPPSRSASYAFPPEPRPTSNRRPTYSRTDGKSRIPPLVRGATMPLPSPKPQTPMRDDREQRDYFFGEIPSATIPVDATPTRRASAAESASADVRRVPGDADVRYGKRYTPEDVKFGNYGGWSGPSAHGGRDAGYAGKEAQYAAGEGQTVKPGVRMASGGGAGAGSRRTSEDGVANASARARAHMRESEGRERPGARRAGTYVY